MAEERDLNEKEEEAENQTAVQNCFGENDDESIICLKCGEMNGKDVDVCWNCGYQHHGEEQCLGLYPCTYELEGLKLNPEGIMMITEKRFILYLVDDALMKAEKKKIKGLFVDKYEKVLQKLVVPENFVGMTPDDFCGCYEGNKEFPFESFRRIVYKKSYFYRGKGAHGGGSGRWRYPSIFIEDDEKFHRIQPKVNGEFPKKEAALVELLERLFGHFIEVTRGTVEDMKK